jgi:hypothetical protein
MKTTSDKYIEFWETLKYDYCYIAVDIHGTIFKPSFDKEETYQYYPMAKQCLQELSKNPRVKLILWSSCFPEKLTAYLNKFKEDGIHFAYANENPECSNSSYACFWQKFYFDIGIDDRFGFDANKDWKYFYPVVYLYNHM